MAVTPREVFERMARDWLRHPAPLTDAHLADDVVIESPFAPPGRPKRFVGRDEFLAFANPQRATLPVRFDGYRTLAVHETTDPDTIVVEYELTGTATHTGRQSSAVFIGVLKVRDGKVALWREYQDTAAIARALSPA